MKRVAEVTEAHHLRTLPATREHCESETAKQKLRRRCNVNSKLDCLSVWHMISTVSDEGLHAIVCEWRTSSRDSRHLFRRFFLWFLLLVASSGRDECVAHIFPFMDALWRGKTRSCSRLPSKLELNKSSSSSSSSIVCHRNLQTTYRSNCLLCSWLLVVGLAYMHSENHMNNCVNSWLRWAVRAPNVISTLLNFTTGKCAPPNAAQQQTKQMTKYCGTAEPRSQELLVSLYPSSDANNEQCERDWVDGK